MSLLCASFFVFALFSQVKCIRFNLLRTGESSLYKYADTASYGNIKCPILTAQIISFTSAFVLPSHAGYCASPLLRRHPTHVQWSERKPVQGRMEKIPCCRQSCRQCRITLIKLHLPEVLQVLVCQWNSNNFGALYDACMQKQVGSWPVITERTQPKPFGRWQQ